VVLPELNSSPHKRTCRWQRLAGAITGRRFAVSRPRMRPAGANPHQQPSCHSAAGTGGSPIHYFFAAPTEISYQRCTRTPLPAYHQLVAFQARSCSEKIEFCVLVLNTTVWIYAPELLPTRIRGLGVAFILASGTAAGSFMPLVSGRVLDSFGLVGLFAMIALMYAIFATCVQFGPETYGKSMEDVTIDAEAVSPLE
jgi:hypothetical protein